MRKRIKYIIAFWIFFFAILFSMGITRNVMLNGSIKGTPKEIVLFLSSFLSNIKEYKKINSQMVVESNLKLKNGFNRSKNYTASKDFLLVSVWNDSIGQSIVKLVRIADGVLLHKWVVNIDELNDIYNTSSTNGEKHRLTKNTTSMQHPVLLPDGSLIFGSGGTYKVDKNSKLIWSNKNKNTHSIEASSEGDYWICGYNRSTRNQKKYLIQDDAIQKISLKTGQIIFEKSVFDLLMENGYGRANFFVNPDFSSQIMYLDYSHLNDIQPALFDGKYWKKDDLFLSLRNQNLIVQYRPSTNKIIWSKKGPWLKQHDVDIIDSNSISIFGNNVIDAQFDKKEKKLVDGYNNLYVINFETNSCTTPYTSFFKSSKIATYTEGLSTILDNGNVFIEETNNGRILFGNKKTAIWSYVERIDETKLSIFNWSRYITEKEFKNLTFLK